MAALDSHEPAFVIVAVKRVMNLSFVDVCTNWRVSDRGSAIAE